MLDQTWQEMGERVFGKRLPRGSCGALEQPQNTLLCAGVSGVGSGNVDITAIKPGRESLNEH